jgi:hypothetical protein
MSTELNKNSIKTFGDFQTPKHLAFQALNRVLEKLPFTPASLIEPTCGKGAFLIEAVKIFPKASAVVGVEVNTLYFDELITEIKSLGIEKNFKIINNDFFAVDWSKMITDLPEPILITGNPPWVTNSALGSMKTKNLPEKNNFQGRGGMEAIMGKSNFDISESMLLEYFKWLENKKGAIAILCKTSVARKILSQAWKNKKPIEYAAIYNIDALSNFNASVDACLFFVLFGKQGLYECDIFEGIESKNTSSHIGYRNNILLSNIDKYKDLEILNAKDPFYKWRSGIKHDCSKIMELTYKEGVLTNGLGEIVNIEEDFLYPLLKSSDLGNGRVKECRKKSIVTQKTVGEDTFKIKYIAPNTWNYLQSHSDKLLLRKSSIYKGKPIFSIFGVGDYSFSPWKVAISALYKKLTFFVINPINDKPVVFDDTVYFLSCGSQSEAKFVCSLLNSEEARSYLESMIFWNEKRPITIDILKHLSLANLAKLLNCYKDYLKHTAFHKTVLITQSKQKSFCF